MDDKNTHIWDTETEELGGENNRTVTDVSKISCVGKEFADVSVRKR